MMYPRLKLARNLLREDGVIFISIDEREYSHLRTLCSEIFGEENQMGTLIWKNATDNNPTNVATEHEYILIVAKGKEALEKEWKWACTDIKDVLIPYREGVTNQFSGQALSDAL